MNLSLDTQKKMNSALAKGNRKQAYNLFVIMNNLRAAEGKDFFTMPNLQKEFEK